MELYKAIKAININNLTEEDKEELLGIFMATKNVLIMNHIVLIFADLHYEKAVPYIFDKINDKSTFNKLELNATDIGANSTLHFVEQTQKLLS